MKIGIIGAGFTGLAAGYALQKKGHTVTIFEKDPHPGGLAIGYKEKDWEWTMECFYHHWFTNDNAVLSLAKTLGYEVLIKRPITSSYIQNHIYQLDSPLTLLQFQNLSPLQRLQMAAVLGFLRFNPFWKPLEKFTAASFLEKTIGKKAYQTLWEPLLVGKFGSYVNDISLAWFWARIKKRTTSLAYPKGGFLSFAQFLSNKVQTLGAHIHYNTSIQHITTDGKTVTLGSQQTFDKVIVTLPSFAFTKLAPQLPQEYKTALLSLSGLGAVVVVMRLHKDFLPNNIYWLNICDTNAPMLAIVEHTHFMDRVHYNNESLVYLGNYLPQDHPYFSLSAEELMKEFDPYLTKINPDYKKNLIAAKKFSVPFAQPIIPTNYSKQIPPFQTPLPNVFLANMQQVYPWDRGTNYAVELGENIATYIDNS